MEPPGPPPGASPDEPEDRPSRGREDAPSGDPVRLPEPGGEELPGDRDDEVPRRERAPLPAAGLRDRLPLWLRTRCGMERRSVVAVAALLVLALTFGVRHFWSGRTETLQPPPLSGAAGAARDAGRGPDAAAGGATRSASGGGPQSAASAGAELYIDITGKVRRPGLRRLPAGSRVVDALRAAGGVPAGTELHGLNRARLLVDGEQLDVGRKPQTPPPGGPGPAGSGAVPPSGGAAAAGTPVALGTATVGELDQLPGVGPVLAQHIVDYRTEHGGFGSVEELREVKGIGEQRFADLRALVRP